LKDGVIDARALKRELIGGGGITDVTRENGAGEWNSSVCERSGQGTRAEQCADVDGARRTAQTVAIGAYAAGAALLTGTILTYLLSHSEEGTAPELLHSIACGSGPTAIGLRCSSTW
jgi:hypothetical protein